LTRLTTSRAAGRCRAAVAAGGSCRWIGLLDLARRNRLAAITTGSVTSDSVSAVTTLAACPTGSGIGIARRSITTGPASARTAGSRSALTVSSIAAGIAAASGIASGRIPGRGQTTMRFATGGPATS
jgi:hypothetical protein